MPAIVKNNILIYEGCNYLRYRLILSTLSGKPVQITNIRPSSDDPGLKGYLKYKYFGKLYNFLMTPINLLFYFVRIWD